MSENTEQILVHLQGIGKIPGKRAMDLEVGDLIMWNYGGITEVMKLEPKGQKSLVMTGRTWSDYRSEEKQWNEDVRTFRRTRPVAIATRFTNKGELIRRAPTPKEKMVFDF